MSGNSQYWKKRLQITIEKVCQHRIYCFSHRKHGHQSYADITYTGHPVRTVFDVGANTGQSAIEYLIAFPAADIYCFEPVSKTAQILRTNLTNPRVHCFQMAMGNAAGDATIYLNENDTTNSLIQSGTSIGQEKVAVTTVDLFMDDHNVRQIDLLKIDTEGFDLEVLKGAQEALREGRVQFVQVEVGFHPSNTRHVLFENIRNLLLPKGYSVFGIYDQFLEWTGQHQLRFANAVFCRTSTPLVSSKR